MKELRKMTDNELLLALSNMMDRKLDSRLAPLESRLKRIEVDLLENNIIPRLNTLESCYLDTFHRYQEEADHVQETREDVALLKKVVAEHITHHS